MTATNKIGLKVFGTYSIPTDDFHSYLTSYVDIPYSTMLIDVDDYPPGTKGSFIVHWASSADGATGYIQLYNTTDSSAVSNSEHSETLTTANVYQTSKTAVPFELASGMKSYKIQLKSTGAHIGVRKIEFKLRI